MPVPNHPDKHASEPLVTPARDIEYAREQEMALADPPSAVMVCFQPSLFEWIRDTRAGPELEGGHPVYDCHRLVEHPDVGVVGGFGFGASLTALVVDELLAWGVERVLAAGYAGCLQLDVGMGEPVVATRALRDEGVSHHYLPDERWVEADDAMVERAREVLDDDGVEYHAGPTWTTDAPYRETRVEVTDYAAAGVLTVEMEAAAVFAVARHRGVPAGALFTVSDYLGEEWDPQFHATEDDLRALFEHALAVLVG